MKKATFTVNGVEVTFTEVMGVFNGDELDTILIHEERDTYHDGDCIVEVGKAFPETVEEAEALLEECSTGICNTTDCFKVENGKYIVND